MTHDYKRHGTTTLFAALDVLDGTVIGRNMQRHRHQEFIRFLNAVEREVPPGKTIHAILDNYATHKHPKVRAWLARHPRWTFHFTPTSCSWLNAVETFVYFSNFYEVESRGADAFSVGGDSGSLVVTDGKGQQVKAVGILIGGNDSKSYVLPLQSILKSLKVTLLGGHNV